MKHPAIRDLFHTLTRSAVFQDLIGQILRRDIRRLSLSGLTTTGKAIHLVLLAQATERPLLVVVDGNKQTDALLELVQTFFDLLVDRPDLPSPQVIPAYDVLPHQRLSPHSEIVEQRAIGLWRLATQRMPITIVPVASALLRTETPDFYRQLALTLRTGEELPLDLLIGHLESIGYERREPVEMVGEYSVRGGILDVFPAESNRPVRVEFFGDEIDSIRRFDPETQRSVLKITEATVLPLIEYPRSRPLFHELAEAVNYEGIVSPGDAFPGWEFAVPMKRPRLHSLLSFTMDPIIVLDEPEQIVAAAERLWKRLADPERETPISAEANFFRWGELQAQIANRTELLLRELELGLSSHDSLHIPSRPSTAFHGSMPVAVAEAKTLVEQGNRVAFFAPTIGGLERLADILQEYSVPFQLGLDPSADGRTTLTERGYLTGAVASTYLIKGAVHKGVVFPDARLVLIGSDDLFDSSDLVARPSLTKTQLAAFAADIADLKPGDYVVHTTHGVGKFLGLREIVQGDQKGDFMLLEYSGESKLYVPLTRLDLVQKFRGAGDAKPQLDRLGGATWSRTKSRVKAKMRDMADELLKLYAERRMAEGFAFSNDSNWQREFEDAFEFTPTKDQVTAVQQVKRDMEDTQPMDRLLCGDVGYGKTEVAMRAAFKALGDGKQVALLAPTTVLAFQHFETFKRRFAPFPVKLELLSRFRTTKELKAAVQEIGEGKVDIVIGTHRLLSADVQFRDLGLLIIDEEQRFGVRHKERLKQMRKNVDVLTMSATPDSPNTAHGFAWHPRHVRHRNPAKGPAGDSHRGRSFR